MKVSRFTASCDFRELLFCTPYGSESRGGHFPQLEVVNGVPVAVKDEAVLAVKGEPVVAVRVELKRSPHTVTASDPV